MQKYKLEHKGETSLMPDLKHSSLCSIAPRILLIINGAVIDMFAFLKYRGKDWVSPNVTHWYHVMLNPEQIGSSIRPN